MHDRSKAIALIVLKDDELMFVGTAYGTVQLCSQLIENTFALSHQSRRRVQCPGPFIKITMFANSCQPNLARYTKRRGISAIAITVELS